MNRRLAPAVFGDVLQQRYAAVRARSLELAAPLSPEDAVAQSMPDASPVKWHLAHTTWFFETFVLEAFAPGYKAHDRAYRYLFNSYYDAVGARHPRPQRGLLTRPSLDQVCAYRRAIDARMARLLADPGADSAALHARIELGLQHEQQHQELILSDVLHLLSCNPLAPAYRSVPRPAPITESPSGWLEYPGGVIEIGARDAGFAFDNEMPRHRVFLEPYALASRLVTNAEWQRFIEAGGYRQPHYWLSEGWDWVQRERVAQPLYWQQDDEKVWRSFGLDGLQPLARHAAVQHVSYYEADAYARWIAEREPGVRLPTEAEWERAAVSQLRPSQLADTAWQWTSSSYAPYPGFAPGAGALGEYNGKFMVNQYVLRGGSHATPAGHARPTYRNFFPAWARWQFTGVRLARSGAAPE
jgi:ergothioneine biosynthesis protein EgtB